MDFADRLRRAAQAASTAGVDALLVTPGPDLRYLVGYDAVALERLTCLVVPASGDPVLVAPRLELLAAQASPVGALGLAVHTWGETDDPYALVGRLIPTARRVAVDDLMWAVKVLALREAMPGVEQQAAGGVLGTLRMRKDAAEVAALARAGDAIDAVHAQVADILTPGMTEADAGRLIGEAILAAGHITVDFIIVASGPNAASPHHEVSDRVMQPGDSVVVDIGGCMPDGYRSDCTRTYMLGEPDPLFRERYAVLERAQAAAVAHVRPGVTCESIDAVARQVMADAGVADLFVHRTGHGIGLETHEAPYIVHGNALPVEPGMAFSIEPGFYDEGRHGARIEDIVIVTEDGCRSVNTRPHGLMICG